MRKFIFSNFLSFKDENILDLRAGKNEKHSDHIIDIDSHKILKSAILYGANASGKSNLIKAVDFAKKLILNQDDTRYKKYFRLSKDFDNKPTNFEFEIVLNNRVYSYGIGILIKQNIIVEEWLYQIDKKEPEMIFERKENNKIIFSKKYFSIESQSRLNIYIEDIENLKDRVFLYDIASKNIEIKDFAIFNDIFKWFNAKLKIIYPNTKSAITPIINKNLELKTRFKNYLQEFNTGIIDISSIEENFEDFAERLPLKLREDIEKDLREKSNEINIILPWIDGSLYIFSKKDNEIIVNKLGLKHKGKDKDDIFELQDESDGTQRLFDFIPLFNKFENDFTILIDEVDRSLHPKLTEQFFKNFYKLSKDFKSQLIVSTHEATLLNLYLVRRDEIIFVEKDKYGSSKLFTLRQFKDTFDEKLNQAYLIGRYGAVPHFNQQGF